MTSSNSIRNNIAVALDNFDRERALQFVRETKHDLGFYKVGLELFLRYGKNLIEEIAKEDVNIFLDLKLHDIPNTVAKSIQSLDGLNIQYLTVHLGGGPSMLSMALDYRDRYLPRTKILGVSYLTSMNEAELKQVYNFKNQEQIQAGFENYFQMASELKIDGVVHSGLELSMANKYSFISVCPGIRFEDEVKSNLVQDQKRVVTPQMALQESSKSKNIILVIGRSLTSPEQGHLFQQRIETLKNIFQQL